MGDWEPLGVRMGWWEDEAPYEGIPPHLQGPLEGWVRKFLGGDGMQSWDREKRDRNLEVIVSRLRLVTARDPITTILAEGDYNPHRVFEAIDMSLFITKGAGAPDLDIVLGIGGSVWTTTGARNGLERRVEPSEREAYKKAIGPRDEAAGHLAEAWQMVYGITSNPSDSWDHSIKAVEALMWGLVIPKNDKATLGSIIAALNSKPTGWTFRLTPSGAIDGVETLVHMLRLMWPNPDRHGSGTVRMPTQAEAEDVVRLAVLVVGWLRGDALVKVP